MEQHNSKYYRLVSVVLELLIENSSRIMWQFGDTFALTSASYRLQEFGVNEDNPNN
jgi:hypothetical protein